MKRYLGIILILGFLFNFSYVFAQGNQEVKMKGDRVIYNEKDRIISLFGNVVFMHQDIILSGNRAIFNSRRKTAQVRGNVKIVQDGSVIKADQMDVFYNSSLAKLRGNVVIKTNRSFIEQKRQKDFSQPSFTIMKTASLNYFWKRRYAKATGGVLVVQGSRRIYGNSANYDGLGQVVNIVGNVRFERGSNDWVTAHKVIYDIKRNVILATGGVCGKFYIKKTSSKEPFFKKVLKRSRVPDKLPSLKLPYLEDLLPQ